MLIFCLSARSIVLSQHFPQYTQYTYNMNIINPAYAGLKNTLSINLLGRKQWVNVEGAPQTGTLGIHKPLGEKQVFGVGFSAIYDQIGPLKETHLYGDVSYKLGVSNNSVLAFGLKLGVSLQNVDQSILKFNSIETLNDNSANSISPNLGFGLYFSEEDFYLSVSIPNILGTNFFETASTLNTIAQVPNSSTVYMGSGYVFKVNKNLKIKPALMLRYSSVFPLSLDISSTAFIKDMLELGVSYRINKSMSILTALNINDSVRIGYSYDFSVGSLNNYNNGSHEILLLFDIELKEKRIKAPKYY